MNDTQKMMNAIFADLKNAFKYRKAATFELNESGNNIKIEVRDLNDGLGINSNLIFRIHNVLLEFMNELPIDFEKSNTGTIFHVFPAPDRAPLCAKYNASKKLQKEIEKRLAGKLAKYNESGIAVHVPDIDDPENALNGTLVVERKEWILGTNDWRNFDETEKAVIAICHEFGFEQIDAGDGDSIDGLNLRCRYFAPPEQP